MVKCTYPGGLLGESQETENVKSLGRCLAFGELRINVTSYNYSLEWPQRDEPSWFLHRITPPSFQQPPLLPISYARLQQFLNHEGSSFYLSYMNFPQIMWLDIVIPLPLLSLTFYKQFIFFSELKK